MLIVNDEQRLRAGIASLSKQCYYCTKALAAYPLIMSDEARLQVYHAACTAALVSGGSRDHFSTEAVPNQGLRPGRSNRMKSVWLLTFRASCS